MKHLIHYLVRHPNEPGSLIFPTELSEVNYVGFGSYYFIGDNGDDVNGNYFIHAIHKEEIVTIPLELVVKTKTIFRANVKSIGSFEFMAVLLKNKPKYIGNDRNLNGKVAIRVLKPKNPNELNDAVRNYGFYFVGYSPRIDHVDFG